MLTGVPRPVSRFEIKTRYATYILSEYFHPTTHLHQTVLTLVHGKNTRIPFGVPVIVKSHNSLAPGQFAAFVLEDGSSFVTHSIQEVIPERMRKPEFNVEQD